MTSYPNYPWTVEKSTSRAQQEWHEHSSQGVWHWQYWCLLRFSCYTSLTGNILKLSTQLPYHWLRLVFWPHWLDSNFHQNFNNWWSRTDSTPVRRDVDANIIGSGQLTWGMQVGQYELNLVF